MRMLDPDSVQAFVLVAELKSFTRAARVLNSTQSAVSLKVQRLEKRIGQRLVERSPRLVRLSKAGETFLTAARALVDAHRAALDVFEERTGRLVVGFSHHIVGAELSVLLRQLPTPDPGMVIDLKVGSSRELLDAYDAGAFDAVFLLRHDESRRGGEVILKERFAWIAAPDFRIAPKAPIPLALQPEPCQIRAMATTVLDAADIPWREAFIGAGVTTVGAAAAGGLAIAAMARRVAPPGTADIGVRLGLPPLASRDVVLHSHVTDARSQDVLNSIVSAFRTCASEASEIQAIA